VAGSRDGAAAGPTSRTHFTTHILQSLRYLGDRGCRPRSSIPDFGGKAADGDQAHLHGPVCGGLGVLLILWSSQAGCFTYVTFPCMRQRMRQHSSCVCRLLVCQASMPSKSNCAQAVPPLDHHAAVWVCLGFICAVVQVVIWHERLTFNWHCKVQYCDTFDL